MHYVYSLLLSLIVWGLAVTSYRLLLHPLARYPGPLWAKISGFRAVYHAFIGDLHLDMLECHHRYGKLLFSCCQLTYAFERAVRLISLRKQAIMCGIHLTS
jgi:hypothetical protein